MGPGLQEAPVGIENLNPVILAVGDLDQPVFV